LSPLGALAQAGKALAQYDYFKAKALYYKSLKKHPREASFGLSVIYSRHDNPFTQIDSAAKYIGRALRSKEPLRPEDPKPAAIDSLAAGIAWDGYGTYIGKNDIGLAEKFLRGFWFASDSLRERAYGYRDQLAFEAARRSNRSDSMQAFMQRYPETSYDEAAFATYEHFVYSEQVRTGSRQELQAFIRQYAPNSYRNTAEEKLFQLVKDLHRPDDVYDFVKHYASALTIEQAWKYLYSISVTSYSQQELQAFLHRYPEYPYRDYVQREINLSVERLLPLQDASERWGYVDTTGTWRIAPRYDDAALFHEGFAAVCANDSCYYINKEGKKATDMVFSETFDYHNGSAIVKHKDSYYLINRSAQLVSAAYQEIGEPAENRYVVKQKGKYGAINLKGAVVIPLIYQKLGDFKNGFAYFVAAGKYGLVDTLNKVYDPEWDWISDVDEGARAVVKKGNLFGILDAPDRLLLPCVYDYVKPVSAGVYLVVKQGKYGFYNAAGRCFVLDPEFDYKPQFDAAYYSNGRLFKRIRPEGVSLVDANGRQSIEPGKYYDVFFAKDDMIRVQLKNQKFGFVDRKLRLVIPAEYEEASDFSDGRAIVQKKGQRSLIDKDGKAAYTCKDCGIKVMDQLYLVSADDVQGLVDREGRQLLPTDYDSIEPFDKDLIIARKEKAIYLYRISTGQLKKLD